MEKEKVIAFNQDQVDHNIRVAMEVQRLCNMLMLDVVSHDRSKFDPEEFEAFVDSRDSLNASTDGKDEDYQKHLKGAAIQHHITTNRHHPEYWDRIRQEMPVDQAIIMFFDWKARCDAKGSTLDRFWDYNMEKLKKHPTAKAVAEGLKRLFG